MSFRAHRRPDLLTGTATNNRQLRKVRGASTHGVPRQPVALQGSWVRGEDGRLMLQWTLRSQQLPSRLITRQRGSAI